MLSIGIQLSPSDFVLVLKRYNPFVLFLEFELGRMF